MLKKLLTFNADNNNIDRVDMEQIGIGLKLLKK